MKKLNYMLVAVTALILFVSPTVSQGTGGETAKVEQASDVLNDIMSIPERGIPEAMLKNAYGVAVFPGLLKAGFIVGARYGEGVLVVKKDNGDWSSPLFVSLGGASVGWQIGAQSTDVILVFKSRKSVDAIANGKFTLGADASVVAGPVGRQAEAATDIVLTAEILSYSRSRGLFAGLALEGAVLQVDSDANRAFYGSSDITPGEILASSGAVAPGAARNFSCTVTKITLSGKCA
jgi:lipid-binding SYLF domain-containing protein